MADSRKRIALKPHMDRIREWVESGKTDDWIADALGTSASSVQCFRSRNDIYRRERGPREPETVFEGVLDHGERDGWGLWLDPSIAEDPIRKEHWIECALCVGRGIAQSVDVHRSVQRDETAAEYQRRHRFPRSLILVHGPNLVLLLAAAVTVFHSSRAAVLSVIAFFIAGAIVLSFVNVEAGEKAARSTHGS